MKEGKIIILSAPSGTGKSTIISRLMEYDDLRLGFSISATSRSPRGSEQHGREYYFLTEREFKDKAAHGEFVEWEEVYPGTCYGTLLSEVERVTHEGRNLIMDVDVKGALNIKRFFGGKALAIFVMPPSKEELESRLRLRSTDSEESIQKRLAKADFEMEFAPKFDAVVVNDDLENAVGLTADRIRQFTEEAER
ncbi:MAG: guanylate kinase [Muribaculaceae bacterium]|nr:guanylate kinase [Muribaculaceae bacterium]